jgi:hypothetical protein
MSAHAENIVVQPPAPAVVGVMGEFADVDAVGKAARKIRAAGFTKWDVHSPFPIHGIDHAMGTKPTILPWLVLGGGLVGLVSGLVLQWFTNAFDYRFMISGKPYMSLPAFIPVVFELTVLLAALTAVFGMFLLNLLPMLYNPLLKIERFRRVTNDRFFVVIDAADPKFDEAKVAAMMVEMGAMAVEKVED